MLSDWLKEMRIKSGLSKAEVARLLNIPYSTYDGYETGYREPKLDQLILITNVLKADLNDYIYREKEKYYRYTVLQQKLPLIEKEIFYFQESLEKEKERQTKTDEMIKAEVRAHEAEIQKLDNMLRDIQKDDIQRLDMIKAQIKHAKEAIRQKEKILEYELAHFKAHESQIKKEIDIRTLSLNLYVQQAEEFLQSSATSTEMEKDKADKIERLIDRLKNASTDEIEKIYKFVDVLF